MSPLSITEAHSAFLRGMDVPIRTDVGRWDTTKHEVLLYDALELAQSTSIVAQQMNCGLLDFPTGESVGDGMRLLARHYASHSLKDSALMWPLFRGLNSIQGTLSATQAAERAYDYLRYTVHRLGRLWDAGLKWMTLYDANMESALIITVCCGYLPGQCPDYRPRCR